jgi:HlyD family secretion protein
MISLRRILIVLVGLVLAGAVLALVMPRPLVVDVARVATGRFELTVEEDGRTRVRERFVVSAPLQGRLLRIEIEAGDPVARGELLAVIVPTPPPLLDARSRQELRERVAAAEAARDRAEAALARARVALDETRVDLERARRLAGEAVLSQKELERSQFAADLRDKDLAAAEFDRDVAVHELEMARAALGQLREEPTAHGIEPWEIRSPVPGRILRVLTENEGVVPAGAPLLELADPGDLEVVVDLLTSDAVQAAPGAPVRIDGWGGAPLEGRVRLVEPGGFTKLSALGVEEQRVNVLIEITSPPEQWRALGDGYRVDAHITLLEHDAALLVPSSALFRDADRWAVYRVESGRAYRRAVGIGARSDQSAVVTEGLGEGDVVIVYPDDDVTDGTRVAARSG